MNKNEVIKRVRTIIERTGYHRKTAAFADRIGFKQGHISTILNGHLLSGVTPRFIQAVQNAFPTYNITEYLTGLSDKLVNTGKTVTGMNNLLQNADKYIKQLEMFKRDLVRA